MTSGTMIPRQFGPMIRAPRRLAELDHLRDVAARDALGDDHDQLDAVLDRLEDGVLGSNAGGTVSTEPSIGEHVVLRRDLLGDGVEDRHAVHIAAACAPA